MSDIELFKQTMFEKQSSFQKLMKLLILIPPKSMDVKRFIRRVDADVDVDVERFIRRVTDWRILNNDCLIQKIHLLTSLWRTLCHIVKYLDNWIATLFQGQVLWQNFSSLCLFVVNLKLSWRVKIQLISSNNNKIKNIPLIFLFKFSSGLNHKW